jgi:hypothetical protein
MGFTSRKRRTQQPRDSESWELQQPHIHGTHVPVDEMSTRSIGDPLFNPDRVQPHSRGMLCPPTKAPDKCRGPGGEQALARGRAPTVRLHLAAMMDTAMMVVAVVKASHPGWAGKGLG